MTTDAAPSPGAGGGDAGTPPGTAPEPPRGSTRPVDPRLLRYSTASRGFFAVTAATVFAQTGVIVGFAWFLTRALVGAIDGEPVASVVPDLLAAAALVAVRALLIAASERTSAVGAARASLQLRDALVRAVERLGPGWLARRNGAALAVTAGHGLEALDAYFGRYLPQLVATAITMPVLILAILLADPVSGITVIVTMPLIPVFMILIGLATRTVQKRQFGTLHRLAARFADTVSGLGTLKVFGRQHRAADSIEQVTRDYKRETMAVLRVSFLSGFALEFLAAISVALIAVTIGFRLLAGEMPLLVGLFVLLLAPEAYLPLRQVGVQFHAAAEGVAATDEIFEVLDAARAAGSAGTAGGAADAEGSADAPPAQDAAAARPSQDAASAAAKPHNATGELNTTPPPSAPPSQDAPSAATKPHNATGELNTTPPASAPVPASVPASAAASAPLLEVRDLRVPRGARVIGPVSLEVRAGEIVLLEGPSGAGKSSVLAALLGFAPFSGEVRAGDGAPGTSAATAAGDLAETAAGRVAATATDGNAATGGTDAAARRILSWGGQRPGLVSGTVGENVALGDDAPDATLVERCLADAQADVAPGIVLGAMGSGLSGGQAQRVAVARALYRLRRGRARVLALDEPTSALDSVTEASLWRALREIADTERAGVLLVSHRTSARAIADRVVRLEAAASVAVRSGIGGGL